MSKNFFSFLTAKNTRTAVTICIGLAINPGQSEIRTSEWWWKAPMQPAIANSAILAKVESIIAKKKIRRKKSMFHNNS